MPLHGFTSLHELEGREYLLYFMVVKWDASSEFWHHIYLRINLFSFTTSFTLPFCFSFQRFIGPRMWISTIKWINEWILLCFAGNAPVEFPNTSNEYRDGGCSWDVADFQRTWPLNVMNVCFSLYCIWLPFIWFEWVNERRKEGNKEGRIKGRKKS